MAGLSGTNAFLPNNPTTFSLTQPVTSGDVDMADAPSAAAPPAPAPTQTQASTAATPAATNFPAAPTPQPNSTPRVTTVSTRSTPVPMSENTAFPLKAAAHGAPVRRFLNEKVTGVLLEGMKRLATEQ